MKRERLTQIVLVMVGLFYLSLIYLLYKDLWHSSWILEGKNENGPMFLSFFITVGSSRHGRIDNVRSFALASPANWRKVGDDRSLACTSRD